MITGRLPRRQPDADRGFALIFTLLVTTLVMVAVATTLTVTSPNILSSKNSQDVAAAMLAAQSGINDAVAYLTNVPACRSETRICPQALGASSANLNRPGLGTAQSFVWTTASSPTSDGYVRVKSVGSEGGVSRTLVADLSLNPSILAYGYYTDYESQSPSFFNSYFQPRTIDITNSTTYGNANAVSSTTRNNNPVPQTASWNGAKNSASTGYPDSVCGQHYYYDSSSSPGRYTAGTTWQESGTLDGQTMSHTGQCELVFTTGMVENGPTYSRDAFLISDAGGTGPTFQQPVYTLWGFAGHSTPAPSGGIYYRQNERGATVNSSGYAPAVASQDITLPTTIGTDGVENNSCVYYGPTRVKLNGDGTATVTSPETVTKNAASDTACYPTGAIANGIVGYTFNYATTGSGTIYVKNLNTPGSGTWPQTSLTSQSTPTPGNEIFYIAPTVTGATAPDQNNTSVANDGCTSSVTFSASAGAACAWSGAATASDAGPYSGYSWKTYTASTCSSAPDTDRELFECDWAKAAGSTTLPVNQNGGGYKALRAAFQADLAKGSCLSDTSNTQLSCLANLLNNDLSPADTTTHRYVANASAIGSATTATQAVGAVPSNPESSDSLFTTVAGTRAQETSTTTPISIGVVRQTSTDGGKTWTSGSQQFAVTVTQTTWAITQAASGGQSYFPNPQDVTTYNTGADSSGAAAGSNGSSQPGDLYVDGVTGGGPLSLIAQDNVELTGNLTKGANNDSSATNPVSITAGADVRNYHPVACTDQTAADINATTPGNCPNDLTGLSTAAYVTSNGAFTSYAPPAQYSNIGTTGDRTIDAAVFTLTGSLRTDNYDRANWVGNLTVNGGIYQSHRGANGVQYSGNGQIARSGTTLQYSYVDLQRAHLPYAPAATYSNNPRVWNVVSISAGV